MIIWRFDYIIIIIIITILNITLISFFLTNPVSSAILSRGATMKIRPFLPVLSYPRHFPFLLSTVAATHIPISVKYNFSF